MTYAALSDVQARMPFTLDANSTPTSTQVADFLDEVSAEIDAVLASQGFTVPVTTPTYFVTALKKVEADGAAARALRMMFPDSRGPGETPAWSFYETAYRDSLKRWEKGLGYPKGADRGSALYPSTYETQNADVPSSYPGSGTNVPLFTERDEY